MYASCLVILILARTVDEYASQEEDQGEPLCLDKLQGPPAPDLAGSRVALSQNWFKMV